MKMRMLCTLALTGSFVGATMVGTPVVSAAVQPAVPSSESQAASTAVSRVLADFNGVLFSSTATSHDCPATNSGGQCWWWAANAYMALISYEEDNHVAANGSSQVYMDLAKTYEALCGVKSVDDSCPVGAFTVNSHGNTYYDDIGWWQQAWINAYKWSGNKEFRSLAEGLWSYVTAHGFHTVCNTITGVAQYYQPSGKPQWGALDAFANALYLRNSAWLYSITGQSQYMAGSGGRGGALAVASFVGKHLIYSYNAITPGTAGSQFMVADHLDDTKCAAGGSQSWLQSQGEMVNAWSDMYAAAKTYCAKSSCSEPASYYNNLADELAGSVVSDRLTSKGGWPFEGMPGQAEPTVDTNGILSEPCEPTKHNKWPYGCKLGTTIGSYQSYLISKGFFERGIYCSNHNFNDSQLTTFASANAASLANLPHFGFLWDSSGPNNPVIFATQTSVLDGLDASLGGSYAMC
jgi:hypothetical protein